MENRLINDMKANLISWDGSVQVGEAILKDNEKLMQELKALNFSLTLEMVDVLKEIIEKTGEIKKVLQGEKNLLVKQLNQMNRKDKMIDHYLVRDHSPSFVDRDI
ncbi:hypothetical protein [Vagococcus sp.]|uniref:hypothetical protein n=1 Tax=Vagococcus sp. TaxID=1933889 RepID=UPI003F99E0E9